MKAHATVTRKRSRWPDAVAAVRETALRGFPAWSETGLGLTFVVTGGSGWKATLRLEGEVE